MLQLLAVASICVEDWGDGGARPEGPKPEARRAEAGGQLAAHEPSLEAPAAVDFGAFRTSENACGNNNCLAENK